MVLEGSSTGKPFAADGTRNWPRNVALVFAQYEEFSTLMWGSMWPATSRRVPSSGPCSAPRGRSEPGRVYGDIAKGTARSALHPGDRPPGRAISP